METLLSDATRSTAGVLLITIVLVESGGLFMLRVVRGAQRATGLQRSFFRAGHAHAGVLVTLALVVQLYVDGAGLDGPLATVARSGIVVPTNASYSPASMSTLRTSLVAGVVTIPGCPINIVR